MLLRALGRVLYAMWCVLGWVVMIVLLGLAAITLLVMGRDRYFGDL